MNRTLANYARQQIIEGLKKKLTLANNIRFKRIYSQNNMDSPIEDIVQNIPEEKLNHALNVVENTIRNEINKRTGRGD
ncbi:MAG: hypothetical protein WD512_01010 [Candidatus Paceibacterota bacterium]